MACANAILLYHCSHGCDPVVPDVAGKVALQYACSNNCGSCVREIFAAAGTKALTVSGTNKHILLTMTINHLYSRAPLHSENILRKMSPCFSCETLLLAVNSLLTFAVTSSQFVEMIYQTPRTTLRNNPTTGHRRSNSVKRLPLYLDHKWQLQIAW